MDEVFLYWEMHMDLNRKEKDSMEDGIWMGCFL